MTLADWIFTAFVLVVIYCLVRLCMISADASLEYGYEDEDGYHSEATRRQDHITVPRAHIRGKLALDEETGL